MYFLLSISKKFTFQYLQYLSIHFSIPLNDFHSDFVWCPHDPVIQQAKKKIDLSWTVKCFSLHKNHIDLLLISPLPHPAFYFCYFWFHMEVYQVSWE